MDSLILRPLLGILVLYEYRTHSYTGGTMYSGSCSIEREDEDRI